MPELPEVETVRRGLAPVLVGTAIVAVDQRRPDLRFPFPPDFAARLTGRRVAALERRAKYLWARLDDGLVLVMHLGMSGSFRIEVDGGIDTPGLFHLPRGAPGLHDHVVMTLSSGVRIVYNDPRRFGFMLLVAGEALTSHPLFAGIGIEPLGDDLDGARLATLFRRSLHIAESGAARPAARRRVGQYLRVRGAASRRPVSATRGRHAREARRQADGARGEARGSDPGGAARSRRRRRLDAARPSSGRR